MELGINIPKNNYTVEHAMIVGQNDDLAFSNLQLICKYYIQNNITDKFFIRFYQTLRYMQTNPGGYRSWIKYSKHEMGTQYPDLMQALGIFAKDDRSICIDNQIITVCDLRHIAGKSFGHIGNGKQNNPYALTALGHKILAYMELVIPANQLQMDVTGKGAKATLFPTGNKRGRKPSSSKTE